MLKKYKADLHIHTCLSPCAELEMTPSRIVKNASEKGIDIIAVTDHNSAENVIAAKKAAQRTELTVLAGMEVTSSEEVHIVALFDDIESVLKLQEIVYKNLQAGKNDEIRFGEQIVVNEKDEVLSFNKRLLIGATSLTAHYIVNTIHSLGGLSIASHVDREAFGVISQLGFVPPDLNLDALEFSPNITIEQAKKRFTEYSHFPWVTSSDAHYLKDLGKRTTSFFLKEPSLSEITSALKNIGGRRAEWG